jgi:hypothetical protein
MPDPTSEADAAPASATAARLPLIVITAGLLAVVAAGMPYYLLDPAGRVRSPMHAWFRPSGYVGQTAGIVACVIFAFLWLYPLRKKFRALAFTGSVGRWLDVHIAAALCLPLLLGIHSGWRFDGLIGLGFAAMLVVCASGVVGRYLYVRIPRSRNGLELTRDETAARRRSLITEIAVAVGDDPGEVERLLRTGQAGRADPGVLAAFAAMLRDDLARWRAGRRLRTRWRARGSRVDPDTLRTVLRLAQREMALEQQVRMLTATHRVFRYWHVAHRPFALTALVAVVVHVAVVVALGATWLR